MLIILCKKCGASIKLLSENDVVFCICGECISSNNSKQEKLKYN
jgi:hypothetical protein